MTFFNAGEETFPTVFCDRQALLGDSQAFQIVGHSPAVPRRLRAKENRRAICIARRVKLPPDLAVLVVVTKFAVFGFVETGHFDFFRRTQTHEQFGNVGVLFTNNITLTNNGGDAGAYFIYKYVAMTLFWATSYFDGWSAGFSPLQRLFARQR